ncbi:hypothetical protein VCHA47P369_70124 [Vibrio chagasii]|nr:hypothetical protein VCHA29O39_110162 [Vibrio chagasii]CAH6808900.1 hypothetical protein VCHA36O157_130072 [Vibrio chagasii]CAH6812680.1 hypothetical protein VCHA28FP16_130068 [Vibrio chagasii]CAH6812906.1 hypothetical protein VCHA28O22_140070 [Vibrio chagasii]CAH6822648.1 hypothetical protein VCHA34P112_160065 [Vibrio chagasii]
MRNELYNKKMWDFNLYLFSMVYFGSIPRSMGMLSNSSKALYSPDMTISI